MSVFLAVGSITKAGQSLFGILLIQFLMVLDVHAQNGSQFDVCLANPSPTVREACVRSGLQSQDPTVRSAALFTSVESRSTLIVEIEEPQEITEAKKLIKAGKHEGSVLGSGLLRSSYRILQSMGGGQISLEIVEVDRQSNTINFVVGDLNKENREKINRGKGSVSGDLFQLNFRYVGTTRDLSQCSFSGIMYQGVELRGSLSCTGAAPLMRSSARISLF